MYVVYIKDYIHHLY